MSNIQETIAKNIIKLRKAKGWTQNDLAFELSYSDKAISKWERGESTPDIEVLIKISEVFGVNIDFLLKEHGESEFGGHSSSKVKFIRDLLILILCGVSILGIATIIYVYTGFVNYENLGSFWILFIWGGSLCALATSFFGIKKHYPLCALISESSWIWLTITAIYTTFLVFDGNNMWMFYLVGIPLQAALCIGFFMKALK